jgi:hypothetical protein
MNWRFFAAACILAVGLLLKAGAPVVPVILGVALAAVISWTTRRRAASKADHW